MKKRKQHEKNLTEEIINKFEPDKKNDFPSDINGSYTGNPKNGEMPIQDADDL